MYSLRSSTKRKRQADESMNPEAVATQTHILDLQDEIPEDWPEGLPHTDRLVEIVSEMRNSSSSRLPRLPAAKNSSNYIVTTTFLKAPFSELLNNERCNVCVKRDRRCLVPEEDGLSTYTCLWCKVLRQKCEAFSERRKSNPKEKREVQEDVVSPALPVNNPPPATSVRRADSPPPAPAPPAASLQEPSSSSTDAHVKMLQAENDRLSSRIGFLEDQSRDFENRLKVLERGFH